MDITFHKAILHSTFTTSPLGWGGGGGGGVWAAATAKNTNIANDTE